jgi:hypothetical protein
MCCVRACGALSCATFRLAKTRDVGTDSAELLVLRRTFVSRSFGGDAREHNINMAIALAGTNLQIFRWFCDYSGYPCLYSIHHMLQSGMRYDKLPGETQ